MPWYPLPPAGGHELTLGFSEPNQNHQNPVCLKNSKQGPSGVAHHLQAGQWLKVSLFLLSFKDTGLLPYKIFVALLLLLVEKKRPEGMAVVNISIKAKCCYSRHWAMFTLLSVWFGGKDTWQRLQALFISSVIDGYWWHTGLWNNLEHFEKRVAKR